MTRGMTEILFEFKRIGDYVQVSAIEPVTNTEVSIVGSPRMNKEALKQIALRKLRYVMTKTAAEKRGGN